MLAEKSSYCNLTISISASIAKTNDYNALCIPVIALKPISLLYLGYSCRIVPCVWPEFALFNNGISFAAFSYCLSNLSANVLVCS
jgi:hypothetical protein